MSGPLLIAQVGCLFEPRCSGITVFMQGKCMEEAISICGHRCNEEALCGQDLLGTCHQCPEWLVTTGLEFDSLDRRRRYKVDA
eukprot:3646435-Amphidinium_carterae.3